MSVLEATLSSEPSGEQAQDPSVLSVFETPGGHQVIQTLVEAEVEGRMQQFVTRTVVTASGQVVCVVREDNEEVRPSALCAAHQPHICCVQHPGKHCSSLAHCQLLAHEPSISAH